MALVIYVCSVCEKCGGTGLIDGEPCSCGGDISGYKVHKVIDLADVETKFDDIEDKVDGVMDKCNDIKEVVDAL